MDAFLTSVSLVALGEVGDKTQLLAFALACRYRVHWPILAGILIATLANHGLSAWLGVILADLVPENWLTLLLGTSFIALGLWMLVPDKDEDVDDGRRWGPFTASLVLFFIAEIGDKTQLATVALAARFDQAFVAVVAGTTLGMLMANAPVIWLGNRVRHPALEKWVHRISAALFVLLGVATLAL
ncbi:MAG: TMEM165/GDT1 family protein [Alcanivoracaceae bacterium]